MSNSSLALYDNLGKLENLREEEAIIHFLRSRKEIIIQNTFRHLHTLYEMYLLSTHAPSGSTISSHTPSASQL